MRSKEFAFAETLKSGLSRNFRPRLFSISGFDALFTGAVAVAKLLLNTIFMPITLITDILTVLGLPGWAISMIYVIVTLIVCFTIINFIVGRSEL